MSNPKRSKEWLLAEEIYGVGVAVRWPLRGYKFEALKEKCGPEAEAAMLAIAEYVLKNFKRRIQGKAKR